MLTLKLTPVSCHHAITHLSNSSGPRFSVTAAAGKRPGEITAWYCGRSLRIPPEVNLRLDVWGLDVEAGIPTSGRFLKFSMNRIKAVQSSFMQLLMFQTLRGKEQLWLLERPVRASYWFPGFSQSENNLGDSNASGQKLELIFIFLV